MDFADDLPEENSAWFCQKRFIKKLAAEDIVHELKHCSTGAAGSLVLGSRRVEPYCKSTETVARHSYDSLAFLDVLDFVSACTSVWSKPFRLQYEDPRLSPESTERAIQAGGYRILLSFV